VAGTEASPLLLGALGVLAFSLTFPATRLAEASFSPLTVGAGRAVPAAVLAVLILAARREPVRPPRAAVRPLLAVVATVGLGFGVLSALALGQVSSVHGAVLTGLIPAATAGMAVLRAGERPRAGYWVVLGLGLAVVIGFALVQGGGRLRLADLLLLVAIAAGGVGYAEGGILARQYGGWRVICWTVILALPVSVPLTAVAVAVQPPRAVTAQAVAGLAYVSLVSMCLGFFVWYQGLARGGVARVGRLQLAQPALTLGWSALLLGEHVSLLAGTAGAAVIAITVLARSQPDRPLARVPLRGSGQRRLLRWSHGGSQGDHRGGGADGRGQQPAEGLFPADRAHQA
jgi:drug/metabolite transporter (DMT)-like permease